MAVSVESPEDLAALIGTELGVSEWVTVDQPMIDAFAAATGDHQWIHVDVERARTEMPGGKTIAHGYLVLSLIPRLINSLYEIRSKKRGINYGLDRVRFIEPVPEGARIRMRTVLKSAEPIRGGHKFLFENTFEIDGVGRPAAISENLIAVYV
jgi:acyl dehydratase